MLDRLQIVKQRFDEISDLIIQPDVISDQKRYVQLNKEYKDLKALAEKRDEENAKKHQRRDGHDRAAEAPQYFRSLPIGMIKVRLRIGVTQTHVRPARFAAGAADEQPG